MPKTPTPEKPDKNYALGDKGVVLTSTPVHVETGELQAAQNAIFSLDRAKHGLSKRPGMTKFNAVAAGGTILALQSVPLPPTFESEDEDTANGTLLYVFEPETGATKRTQSVDGLAWTQPANVVLDTLTCRNHCFHKTGGILLAPKSKGAGANIIFASFDGTTWADAFTMADRVIGAGTYSPRIIRGMDQDDDNFYVVAAFVLSAGSGANHDALVQIDQTTYAETYLGEVFCNGTGPLTGSILNTSIADVAVYQGKVWAIGTTIMSGLYPAARVWQILPGGTAWTLDMDVGGAGASSAYAGRKICGHGDQLWASWTRAGAYATLPIFRKRQGEVWTTVATGGVNGYDYYDPVFATGDEMYAWKTPETAGTGLQLVYTADGGVSLTTVATVATDIDPLTSAIRWEVDDGIYCVIGNGGTTFQIWELTTRAAVFTNAGTVQAGMSLIGAATAPTTPVTPDWTLDTIDPADPVLPTAPDSVMAKVAAYVGANVNIPPRDVPLAFTATEYNVGTMFVAATPTYLTVPYGGDGYYLITAQVGWNNGAGTRGFFANLTVNGSVAARAYAEGNVSANHVFCRFSTLVKLVAGDRLALHVRQTGYNAWAVIGGSSETFLHALRVL